MSFFLGNNGKIHAMTEAKGFLLRLSLNRLISFDETRLY